MTVSKYWRKRVVVVFVALLISSVVVDWVGRESTYLSSSGNGEVLVNRHNIAETPPNVYSTYFGGSRSEIIFNVLTDSDGNLIIVGETASTDLPTLNAYQVEYGHGGDGFVAKFGSNDELLWSTYFGGSANDRALSAGVDEEGNIMVIGHTASTDFPILNAYQETYGGGDSDAWYAGFDDAGNLLFSTYFGGTGADWFNGMGMDLDGNGVGLGGTSSSNLSMSQNAVQGSYSGDTDALIVKFNEDSLAPVYSTYLGGAGGMDHVIAADFDESGNMVLVGISASNYTATAGAFQEDFKGGDGDVLVAEISADGESLAFATLLGGTEWDFGGRIAFDSNGDIIVSGYSYSSDFPVQDPYQAAMADDTADAFVAKLHRSGSSLVFSTFCGGNDDEHAYGMAVLDDDSIIISGWTFSTDYPTLSPIQETNAGSSDAFITRFNPDGQSLNYSTYFGGSGSDNGEGVTVDDEGFLTLVGFTSSSDFPTTPNAYQGNKSGMDDIFISRFGVESGTEETNGDSPAGFELVIFGVVVSIAAVIVVAALKLRTKEPI
ncbi:MAG: hypothetical protein ACW99U_13260 [Candidatus Thorarchaeota archaeon]|jgi:hypothetical protein